MDWKEFFKFDWKKLILTLIVILLFVNIPEYPLKSGGCSNWYVDGECVPNKPYPDFSLAFPRALYRVIIGYFLSCVGFWVYNKKFRK